MIIFVEKKRLKNYVNYDFIMFSVLYILNQKFFMVVGLYFNYGFCKKKIIQFILKKNLIYLIVRQIINKLSLKKEKLRK